MTLTAPVPQAAARALAIAAQGLDRRPRRRARKADVLAAIRRMGALQIDTIHVVARSPYLVLWSRLGEYEPAWLDQLLESRRIFEYWAHEACFLPIEDYPLFGGRMAEPHLQGWHYRPEFMADHGAEVEGVRRHLREARGGVRSADFERPDGRKGGGWWGWKLEKRILEYLLTAGEVMVARRERFQRVYDLRERVLPPRFGGPPPPREEADRVLALKALRALGIARAGWVADYYRSARRPTAERVRRLANEGAVLTVTVEGWKEPGFVHPDNAALLERAAAGTLRPSHTTLLSPFDPLVWDRLRTRALFDFDYALECYLPAHRRRWGYYVLPILRRDRLVGRLDAKAHRQGGIFLVKSLWLEPGVRTTERLARDLARALADCAAWHRTPRVALHRTEPPRFGDMLESALAEMAADAPAEHAAGAPDPGGGQP